MIIFKSISSVTKNGLLNIKEWARSIDWKLLLFLLLFLNVKLLVKIIAIVLIYALRPDIKFGFNFKRSRLPLFYLLAPTIGIFNYFLSGKMNNFNYGIVVVMGLFFWVLCILAVHQIKLAVENNDASIIYNTILFFFIINTLFSLLTYLGIIWETGSLNPYRYQGIFQKYFIGTGDYIKGVTLDTSTTNAVLNTFGIVFFMLRNKNLPALMCMITLLLTGSNVSNIFLSLVFIFLFIFQTNKDQKSIIVIWFGMLILFLAKVSPENDHYIFSNIDKIFNRTPAESGITKKPVPLKERTDSTLNTEEKKEKVATLYVDSMNNAMLKAEMPVSKTNPIADPISILNARPALPQDNIHSPPFQFKNDTNAFKKQLIAFIKKDSAELLLANNTALSNLPGKALAIKQTINFFARHPTKLLTGLGMGNFSSKLAFRATAMNIAGGYLEKYTYINEDFKTGHLDIYLSFFVKTGRLHSLINAPNSTYDQLMSEYGIAGLVGFFAAYLFFFTRRIKLNTYGLPILLLMSAFFLMDYWFEQLSVVVFFELLLLLNIKELGK